MCVLKRDLELEHIRRQAIEDKAKTNVFSITLVTAMFVGFILITLNILQADLGSFAWVVPLLMLCGAMLFLLLGGLIALETLRVDKVALWTAEEEILPVEEQKAILIGYMEYNRLVNTKKSNKVDTSYVLIRNGVAILALVILMSVLISVCDILQPTLDIGATSNTSWTEILRLRL